MYPVRGIPNGSIQTSFRDAVGRVYEERRYWAKGVRCGRMVDICRWPARTRFATSLPTRNLFSLFSSLSLSLTHSLPSFFLFRSIEGRRVCGIKFFATDKMNFKFSHSLFNNIERRDGDTFRWPFWMYRGCTWNNVSFLRTFDPFFFVITRVILCSNSFLSMMINVNNKCCG